MNADEQPYPPIADYALIGDCHSAALVSRDGGIDWCCFHRFDARPVFARILDWQRGGTFRIAPTAAYGTTRRYLPATNVLETTFRTGSGEVVVLDCFPVRRRLRTDEGDILHPYHELVRIVRCTRGEVEVGVDFSPRFDYGTTVPRVVVESPDLATAFGGSDALLLQSDLPLARREVGACGCHRTMGAGDEAVLVLTHDVSHLLKEHRHEREEVHRRVDETIAFWREWADRCTYDGPYRDVVVRSALALKALTNAPNGAIAAAPTTSLPEKIGGVRNWDYRFTWLRDAALTLHALFNIGYTEEAHAFFHWLERTTAGRADEIQALYGLGGEHLIYEHEIPQLEGYRGSAPVRIGNGAVHQFQLDAYGELLDAAWLFHRHGGDVDERFWELLAGAADVIAKRWMDVDDGIWEVRGGGKHFVHSKVLAWAGLDRAIRLSREADLPPSADWETVRDEIRERVLVEGVDAETNAFVQAFGSDELDAATLLVPIVEFLPPDDHRVVATRERIASELAKEGLVRRYVGVDDGLPPGEGSFLLCSFWLVDNLALAGELDPARELFERLCGFLNDVGLLAEQVDADNGEFLGNFPQAFSHIGLINSAIHLERADRGTVEHEPLRPER